MDTTQSIAFVAGIYFIITGLGFLFSTPFYLRMVQMGERSDPVLINLSGAAHLIIGLIILRQHLLWTSGTEIAVTLVGFMATLKGAALIIIPEAILKTGAQTAKTIRGISIGFLGYGFFLLMICFGLI